MTKPNASALLEELHRVTFRLDVWPKDGERTLCRCRRDIEPGAFMVWKEGPTRSPPHLGAVPYRQGLGMCLECGKADLVKHRALVADLEWRAKREGLDGARFTELRGISIDDIVAPPNALDAFRGRAMAEAVGLRAKTAHERLMEHRFWEVPALGQVAVTSIETSMEGLRVALQAMSGRFRSRVELFPFGVQPEERGWRVAERLTPEEVREKLGLEPFETFKGANAARGLPSAPQRGRGSGRTTKMLCTAISKATYGLSPCVLVHNGSFASYIRAELRQLCKTLGPLGDVALRRITVTESRDEWEGRRLVDPSVAFKDHWVTNAS
jgi:hypothetical protein